MADLSKIMIPDGTTYTIKDETARSVANSKSEVSVSQTLTSGTEIASITVDGTSTTLYSPSGGGGGLTFDDIYPVGSVFCSNSLSVSPASLFGGTWTHNKEDYVIDEELWKTYNAWNYRKWASGLLECWIRYYIDSMNINTTTGQLKYGNVSLTASQRTYPVAFTDYPTVTIDGNVSGGNGWVVMNNTDYSATRLGTMVAYSSASRTGVGVTVNVYARGLWSHTDYRYYEWTRTA